MLLFNGNISYTNNECSYYQNLFNRKEKWIYILSTNRKQENIWKRLHIEFCLTSSDGDGETVRLCHFKCVLSCHNVVLITIVHTQTWNLKLWGSNVQEPKVLLLINLNAAFHRTDSFFPHHLFSYLQYFQKCKCIYVFIRRGILCKVKNGTEKKNLFSCCWSFLNQLLSNVGPVLLCI